MKTFHLLIFAAIAGNLSAQDAVSNADLARKLDLILNKVDSLEERITSLEGAKSTPKAPATAAPVTVAPAPRPSPAPAQPAIPQDPKEKKSFFQKLKQELKSDEARAAGPWTDPDTWNKIHNNLTDVMVRRILGNPTKVKNSINPRIDRIYRYEGDLDADGVEDKGVVNFRRGRVVSFESPFK
ncbi:uncharacterized protein METZ01_LOCUS478860 [marine metagenome]|uniref:Uncharacterized protein n=1 Tax=marine metagenome TaxID=408172 RepID=A0A383C0M7_9ZZZZ